MYDLSGELNVIPITTLWLQNLRKVSKQAAKKFDVERFNLKKLSERWLESSIRLRSQTGLQLWRT
jgi:hypothetical protein